VRVIRRRTRAERRTIPSHWLVLGFDDRDTLVRIVADSIDLAYLTREFEESV
jgi:hypothetical protein